MRRLLLVTLLVICLGSLPAAFAQQSSPQITAVTPNSGPGGVIEERHA